jgi:hypothetical protein
MKSKTLYYCPIDPDMLMFEDAFDERVDFAYEPPQEIPRICPKCGRLLLKKDCEVIEELLFSLPSAPPAGAGARGQTP